MSVENIVAKHQATCAVAEKFATNDESLRQPVGRGLYGVGELEPLKTPIARNCANRGVSCRVEITRISRIPPSIKVLNG